MMKSEFEALIGREIEQEDFNTINYLYIYSDEFAEREQIAHFYLTGGMEAVNEYRSFMDRTEAIWTEEPYDGDFPGRTKMEALVRKALEPQKEPVDIWDWEFRTFLRDISRILHDVSPEVIQNITKHASQMYENQTLVALTKTFAQKNLEQIEDRCWCMQSYLGDNTPIAALIDYCGMYLNMIRELGYSI